MVIRFQGVFMKILAAGMVAVALALAGCAESTPDQVNPKGDYPDLKTGHVDQTGTLNVEGIASGPYHTENPGRIGPMQSDLYSVYDSEGRYIMSSRKGSVELPAGRYLVRLYDEDRSPFWVTIENGRTTNIDVNRIDDARPSTAPVQ